MVMAVLSGLRKSWMTMRTRLSRRASSSRSRSSVFAAPRAQTVVEPFHPQQQFLPGQRLGLVEGF